MKFRNATITLKRPFLVSLLRPTSYSLADRNRMLLNTVEEIRQTVPDDSISIEEKQVETPEGASIEYVMIKNKEGKFVINLGALGHMWSTGLSDAPGGYFQFHSVLPEDRWLYASLLQALKKHAKLEFNSEPIFSD